MIEPMRAPVAAAMVLLLACSASAAAQQRQCTAADSARVVWSSPPGVEPETWRGTLLARRMAAPGAEMIHLVADSMPGFGDSGYELAREVMRVAEARVGEQRPARFVALPRVEADGTLSRLLLVLPSGEMDEVRNSISETIRRLRYRTVFRNGCPAVTLSPFHFEVGPTVTISGSGRGVQAPPGNGAAGEWVNLVSVWRLRDEFARRPREARYAGLHEQTWGAFDMRVDFPEPFASRAFVGETFALLDVDSVGGAAGCRPLRPGEHPELDAFACTLLMRRGSYSATPGPARGSLAGQWVIGLRWEGLTAAAYRERMEAMQSPAVTGPVAMRRPQDDRWLEIRRGNEGGGTWIDTSSVVQVRADVFRYSERSVYETPLRRMSDGLVVTGSESLKEFDCRRARDRTLVSKDLLGERVVEQKEFPTPDWSTGKVEWARDMYCPVLRQARPEIAPSP